MISDSRKHTKCSHTLRREDQSDWLLINKQQPCHHDGLGATDALLGKGIRTFAEILWLVIRSYYSRGTHD